MAKIDREKVIKGMEQFRADLKPFCGNHADWERFDAGLSMLKEQDTEIIGIRAENRRIFSENIRLNRLLKEREAVKPNNDAFGHPYCPKCKVLVYQTWNYCPHCGQAVKWDDSF